MRIELAGVRKRFGRTAALDGITLEVPSGRKVALIGPNGSGKSTLTRIIMGLLACEGEVRLDGRSPFRERAALAHRLAYVPQAAPAMGATAGELARFVTRTRNLDPTALTTVAARLDLDMDAAAHKPVRALSGGMKQKFLIALAFASSSSLLILDEPTASLDARTRQAFFELVGEASAGATVLLCSHRLEEVRHLVDHVVALEGGRVVFYGPVQGFLRSSGQSVVEVYTADEAKAAWLAARGFARGTQGAWARTLPHAEKMTLLKEVFSTFNGQLQNVLVRDLESLEVASAGEESHRG